MLNIVERYQIINIVEFHLEFLLVVQMDIPFVYLFVILCACLFVPFFRARLDTRGESVAKVQYGFLYFMMVCLEECGKIIKIQILRRWGVVKSSVHNFGVKYFEENLPLWGALFDGTCSPHCHYTCKRAKQW